MNAQPKYYVGDPERCEICAGEITLMFVDGATRQGWWANMCKECFARHGRGLGMGVGQKYERQDDGRWLKTGG